MDLGVVCTGALVVVTVVAYVGGRRDGARTARYDERRRWLDLLRILNVARSGDADFRARVLKRAHQISERGWTNNVVERRGRAGGAGP